MNRRRFLAVLPLPILSARIALSEDGVVSIPEGECEIECFDEDMNPVPCLDPCPEPEPVCYMMADTCTVCCRRADGSTFCYQECDPSEPVDDDDSPHVVNDTPVIVSLPHTGTGG